MEFKAPESVIKVSSGREALSPEENFLPEDFTKVDEFGNQYLLKIPESGNLAKYVVNPLFGRDPSKLDPGWFGSLFQAAGYNWLGPGTDIAYNQAHGIKPVDWIDEAAMQHDLAYQRIANDLEHSRISYAEAQRRIAEADVVLNRTLQQNNWFSVPASIASAGMSSKILYDYLTNSSSFAGISPEDYGKLKDETPEVDYPDLAYDATLNPYQVFGDPGEGLIWVYGAYGWETSSSRHPGEYAPPKPSQPPLARIQVVDRNNDGIPDVLQHRRRRRRIYNFS